MAASGRTNLAMGLEITLSTPYLVAPSPQALSLVVTSIPEREVLAVDDLVLVVEDVQLRAVLARAPAVPVRVPAVGVIDCWSQTWAMTSQKSHQSLQIQSPRQPRLYPLNFRLSVSNNGGSLLKRRRRGCTRVPWLELNRYKVSSRFLPLSRAHRFARYVESCNL
jgi:hypothetical protein